MEIKIKKLDPKAVSPARQKVGDAGYDLVATSLSFQADFDEYGIGLAFEIPNGHVGLVFPRSSISKKDQFLCNHVAVIDSNFRGEVKLRFKQSKGSGTFKEYAVGDRIGQLIILPLPEVTFTEVDELGDSERGDGSFGSSGQ